MRFFYRVLLTLTALSVGFWLDARTIPRQRAQETAETFFNATGASGARRGHALTLARDDGSDSARSLWIFNRSGGGFVVIAGNDAADPVLAYSLTGEFPSKEQMPDNMAWWFGKLETALSSISQDAPQSEAIRHRWANPAAKRSVATKAFPATVQYETASWGQDAPFNNACPKSKSKRCVTGCVATAAAIVARYFQWPDAGEGTVPGYSSGRVRVYSHDLGYSYDWANMPLSYSGNYTSAQASAVATLMYDMGTIAEMDYGTSYSSASESVLMVGMKNHMKYNKGAYLAYMDDYDSESWLNLVKQNLQNGPCMYGGADPSDGGHEFVIDGYDERDMVSVNWGWDGGWNCFCNLSDVTDGDSHFTEEVTMIVDLVPDRTGTSTYSDRLVYWGGTIDGDSFYGLTATTAEFAKNVPFKCSFGWLEPSVTDFDGQVYVSLFDKYGNLKQDISSAIDMELEMGYIYYETDINCKITVDIAPGDKIMVRYQGQYNSGVINFGANCTTEIVVMEDTWGGEDPAAGHTAAETAGSVSLAYDKATSALTLTCQHAVNWSVKNSGGTQVAGGKTYAAGSILIDTSGYAPGTYTIFIGSLEDLFSFTITK